MPARGVVVLSLPTEREVHQNHTPGNLHQVYRAVVFLQIIIRTFPDTRNYFGMTRFSGGNRTFPGSLKKPAFQNHEKRSGFYRGTDFRTLKLRLAAPVALKEFSLRFEPIMFRGPFSKFFRKTRIAGLLSVLKSLLASWWILRALEIR